MALRGIHIADLILKPPIVFDDYKTFNETTYFDLPSYDNFDTVDDYFTELVNYYAVFYSYHRGYLEIANYVSPAMFTMRVEALFDDLEPLDVFHGPGQRGIYRLMLTIRDPDTDALTFTSADASIQRYSRDLGPNGSLKGDVTVIFSDNFQPLFVRIEEEIGGPVTKSAIENYINLNFHHLGLHGGYEIADEGEVVSIYGVDFLVIPPESNN